MKPGAELAPAREAQGYPYSRLPRDVGQPDCAHFDRWTRTPSHLEGDRASEEGDVWRDCAFESEAAAHPVSTRGARAVSSVAAEAQPTKSRTPDASDVLGDQPVNGSDLATLERVGALQGKRRHATPVHGGHVAALIVVSGVCGWLIGATARDVLGDASTLQRPATSQSANAADLRTPVRSAQRGEIPIAANLSGWWTITNEVEVASDAGYRGARLDYRLHLQQQGAYVSGQGRQVTENGRQLGPTGERPIVVQGSAIGDRLALAFTEHDSRRVNRGTFVFRVTPDGVLQGSFESDAARARGNSVARRAAAPGL